MTFAALRRALAALTIATAGCSDPVGVETDILKARVVSASLGLTNQTRFPVYYFAVDRNTLAVIDWAICMDPTRCESVPARSTRWVPLTEIFGADENSEIVVFHWRLVPGESPTGFVPDSVRSLVTPPR